MEDQALSHNFISAIFGIFGIFLVEICGRKKIRRILFWSKKNSIEKIFFRNEKKSRINLENVFFDFRVPECIFFKGSYT